MIIWAGFLTSTLFVFAIDYLAGFCWAAAWVTAGIAKGVTDFVRGYRGDYNQPRWTTEAACRDHHAAATDQPDPEEA